MLVMQVVDTIKHLYKKGMSEREINRKTGYSRNTISKYIKGGKVGYSRSLETLSPKKATIRPIIKEWLIEDEDAPRKQRRTRKKIFQDLVDQYDFEGSYSTVKEVVREFKPIHKEAFVPRHHAPGDYGEFDFGELYIDIGEMRTKVYLHAYQLPYSNAKFGYISIRATQEEIFESHKRSFSHFEGVPNTIRYDNLRQAVTRILKGSLREENQQFIRFREQFGYASEFCEPGKGNQKGDVEGCVGYIRRNFFCPVIKIKDVSELEGVNERLAEWCKSDAKTASVPDTDQTVSQLFMAEKSELNFVAGHIKDVGKYTTAKANHYSMISVMHNFYSVPVKYAHQQVDVLIGAREIIVYAKTKEIARHLRCFQKNKQIYDATHYIELFKRKPYALVNGKPIKQLPNAFGVFFAKAYHQGCIKHCVGVLELLKTHRPEQIATAIELSMAYDTYSSEGVKNILGQLQTDYPEIQKLTQFRRPDLETIKIPSVDLNRYNVLISQEKPHV